jgi:hypothetical protein
MTSIQNQINGVLMNLLPAQFKLLPEDIIYYVIGEFLELKKEQKEYQQTILYIIYYKNCIYNMKAFTSYEINKYFHKEDYFAISLKHHDDTSLNYIKYNLTQLRYKMKNGKYIFDTIVDNKSYNNLKKIVILSKIKGRIQRMKKRNGIIR